jgi:hypothetical protein
VVAYLQDEHAAQYITAHHHESMTDHRPSPPFAHLNLAGLNLNCCTERKYLPNETATFPAQPARLSALSRLPTEYCVLIPQEGSRTKHLCFALRGMPVSDVANLDKAEPCCLWLEPSSSTSLKLIPRTCPGMADTNTNPIVSFVRSMVSRHRRSTCQRCRDSGTAGSLYPSSQQ